MTTLVSLLKWHRFDNSHPQSPECCQRQPQLQHRSCCPQPELLTAGDPDRNSQRSHLPHSHPPPCLDPVLSMPPSFLTCQTGTPQVLSPPFRVGRQTRQGKEAWACPDPVTPNSNGVKSHSLNLSPDFLWCDLLPSGLALPSAEHGIHRPWVFKQCRRHLAVPFLPDTFSIREKTINLLLQDVSCSTVKNSTGEVFCEAQHKDTRKQRKQRKPAWQQNTVWHYRRWLRG